MAFLDNMKGKLSQASQTTVQKAKDLSEIAKLNSTISDAEKKISDLYGKIGYEIYAAYHDKPLPEVEELIKNVSELHKSVETCREQIKIINAANICPQCGAKVNKGMAFCSGCGYKLTPEQLPVEAEKPAFCNNCGAELLQDAVFCASCGQKVQ